MQEKKREKKNQGDGIGREEGKRGGMKRGEVLLHSMD